MYEWAHCTSCLILFRLRKVTVPSDAPLWRKPVTFALDSSKHPHDCDTHTHKERNTLHQIRPQHKQNHWVRKIHVVVSVLVGRHSVGGAQFWWYVTEAQAADTGGQVSHMDHDSLKSAWLRQLTYKHRRWYLMIWSLVLVQHVLRWSREAHGDKRRISIPPPVRSHTLTKFVRHSAKTAHWHTQIC